jgi:hypothetical protein
MKYMTLQLESSINYCILSLHLKFLVTQVPIEPKGLEKANLLTFHLIKEVELCYYILRNTYLS